jgi:hypothetical protein
LGIRHAVERFSALQMCQMLEWHKTRPGKTTVIRKQGLLNYGAMVCKMGADERSLIRKPALISVGDDAPLFYRYRRALAARKRTQQCGALAVILPASIPMKLRQARIANAHLINTLLRIYLKHKFWIFQSINKAFYFRLGNCRLLRRH